MITVTIDTGSAAFANKGEEVGLIEEDDYSSWSKPGNNRFNGLPWAG